ncbi:AsnC family transcriptional regulator [Aquitalea magnusonii]|uniref:Lrp/AsnC family transcriptional regulator n=1 Tax=Aquitalea TaxID=407217 RepID=UPI0005F78118|nr:MULTISPECIES: Lrp/AsnC family transcriptional regulator [Aquitalea]KJV30697.1 AsnC family transcriptional regulator [Aquitalea magnusonii]NWK78941.1 Lrp/AsnC family transcriptional regulator [Aquitalea sp. LB_tupeE]QBJ78997.1 Lrp/AsnC family transcriptional regulator [Aquitalea sp. USM4]
MELDRFDWQILQALQQDARSTHQKLAQEIPLSASQIGRRLQRMEENGVVQGYQVNILPDRIGLSVMAFAHVSLERHNESALREFAQAIHALPEVLECYATAGEADYLLRIVVEDLPSLSRFVMNRLMQLSLVRSVKSTIILDAIKHTSKLPLPHTRS